MIVENEDGTTVSIHGGAVRIDGVPETELHKKHHTRTATPGITTLSVVNEGSIRHSSKLVWSEGTMPHRIVLREIKAPSLKEGSEWVTHMENLAFVEDHFEHRDFYWGHYFGADQKKAMEDFSARAAKL